MKKSMKIIHEVYEIDITNKLSRYADGVNGCTGSTIFQSDLVGANEVYCMAGDYGVLTPASGQRRPHYTPMLIHAYRDVPRNEVDTLVNSKQPMKKTSSGFFKQFKDEAEYADCIVAKHFYTYFLNNGTMVPINLRVDLVWNGNSYNKRLHIDASTNIEWRSQTHCYFRFKPANYTVYQITK